MINFLLLSGYIAIILAEKVYFLFSEPAYKVSYLGRLNLIILFLLVAVGISSYIWSLINKKKENKKSRIRLRVESSDLICVLLIALTLGASLYLNYHKVAQEWDSVALYDARAKFMEKGLRLSQMSEFSKYDEIKYYYLMYPPYTSIAHYFWNEAGIGLPVSAYYSLYLMVFALTLFFASKGLLGTRLSLLLVLLTISNKDIFLISTLEYTNLPYTTTVVLGIALLAEYLRTPKVWKFLYSVVLISSSQWIRYWEPTWILVAVCLTLVFLINKDRGRSFLGVLLLILVSLIEFFSWGYFTKTIAGSLSPIKFSFKFITDPLIGVLKGKIFYVGMYFLKWLGVLLLGYGLVCTTGLISWKAILRRKDILFLFMVVALGIPFYFAIVYMSYFQGDWWSSLGGSITRSASFMVSISILFILVVYKEIINKGTSMVPKKTIHEIK